MVFCSYPDKEDYDSRNGCTVLEQKLLDESYMGGSGSLKASFEYFHGLQ